MAVEQGKQRATKGFVDAVVVFPELRVANVALEGSGFAIARCCCNG